MWKFLFREGLFPALVQTIQFSVANVFSLKLAAETSRQLRLWQGKHTGPPSLLPLFWWFILGCPPGPGSTWPKHRHTPTRLPQTCPPPRQPTASPSATLAAVLVLPLVPVPWCHGALEPVCSGHQTCVRQGVSPPRPAPPNPTHRLHSWSLDSCPLHSPQLGRGKLKSKIIV